MSEQSLGEVEHPQPQQDGQGDWELKYKEKCREVEQLKEQMTGWAEKAREKVQMLTSANSSLSSALELAQAEAAKNLEANRLLQQELQTEHSARLSLETQLSEFQKSNQSKQSSDDEIFRNEISRLNEIVLEYRILQDALRTAWNKLPKSQTTTTATTPIDMLAALSEHALPLTAVEPADDGVDETSMTPAQLVSHLRHQLQEQEDLTLTIKQRAKDMLRSNKTTLKKLTQGLITLKTDVNNFGADFEEMQESVRNLLQWPAVLGNTSEEFMTLMERAREIEEKESEVLWLRGRNDALTSDRDTLAIQNKALQVDRSNLMDAREKIRNLENSVNDLQGQTATLQTRLVLAQQAETTLEAKMKSRDEAHNVVVVDLTNRLREANEKWESVQQREIACEQRESENNLIRTQLVQLTSNLEDAQYERSILESRNEELMRKLEGLTDSLSKSQNEVREAVKQMNETQTLHLDERRELVSQIEQQRKRAALAEDRLRRQTQDREAEGERFESDKWRGIAGQEQQLEVFVDSHAEFKRTLDLYLAVLSDELSIRTAVTGSEIEQVLGRGNISSDSPSPELIDKAVEAMRTINATTKQLKKLSKLLRRLCLEGERWDWSVQIRDNIRDVVSSMVRCTSHAGWTCAACLCYRRFVPDSRSDLSLAEKVEKLKSMRKSKSKKGYAKVDTHNAQDSMRFLAEHSDELFDSD